MFDVSPIDSRRSSAARLQSASSSGASVAALLFAAVVATGTVPRSAHASSRSGTQVASESVDVPFDGSPRTVELRRASDQRPRLAVLSASDGEPAAEVALPDWLSPSDVELSARARRLTDRDGVVLVELDVSAGGGGSSRASVLQFAWHVSRQNDGRLRWALVGRTRSSRIDPGRRLVLAEADGGRSAMLIEERPSEGRFCGAEATGRTVYRRFRPDAGAFEEIVDLEPYRRRARPLSAHLPEEPLEGPHTRGVYQWFRASSQWRPESAPDGTARPMELGDREGGTAWIVDAEEGGAQGAFATATVSDAVRLRGLQIVPGLAGSADHYHRLGRPDRLLVTLADGRTFRVDLPRVSFRRLVDARGVFVEFPEPVRTSCLSVALLDFEAGDAGRVALAEVAPWTVIDRRSARATADRAVAAIAEETSRERRRAIGRLARSLDDQLTAAVERALAQTEGERRRRIVPLLDDAPADRAIPLLTDMLRELAPDEPEWRAVERSLVSHGPRAAHPVAEVLERYGVDDAKYRVLVRLLGRIGEVDSLAALTDDLGVGSPRVRRDRCRAVARGGPAILPTLFDMVEEGGSPARRDALRAVYLVARRIQADAPTRVDGRQRLREVMASSTDRRNLVLAFRASRNLAVDDIAGAARRALDAQLGVAVREEAVRATGAYTTEASRRLAELALEDDSPDVRSAAVEALTRRRSIGPAAAALKALVRRERWPAVRQRALAVLADRAPAETEDFFERLIRNRSGDRVAVQAAGALFGARRSIDPELVRELVLDDSTHRRLRLEAVDLLGLDDSEAGHDLLIDLGNPDWLSTRIESRERLRRIRLRAILALGRRRRPADGRRLVDLAKSSSPMTVRRHAIRALAFYDVPELRESLAAWRPEAPPALRSALDRTIEIIADRPTVEQLDQRSGETTEASEERE